ncbi:MAG: DUF370 domain-containing protein [Tissierellia bacterium]|nr:DUF370 domain-containing protein [Tissierellia bacterium]
MNNKLINIGYGNYVQLERVVAIISPDSAPIKRMVQNIRDSLNLIDATFGRKTRSVIILDSKQIVLSALQPDTINARIAENNSN